ncbi:hypothetical protein J6590_033640 [Homalodisca vitripennis]|nr:hypothetical protein J6590_033640 [Homalodisca vitripennis]
MDDVLRSPVFTGLWTISRRETVTDDADNYISTQEQAVGVSVISGKGDARPFPPLTRYKGWVASGRVSGPPASPDTGCCLL